MTAEWTSAVASMVGAFTAAIGLYAIWRTLRHAEKQNENSIYQLVTSRMASITQTFLELPELRPYFYDGRDPADLSSTDPLLHARVQAMCEMLFDHAEVVLARPQVMGSLGESYRAYFCDLVSHSLALQDYWRKRRHWYIASLQEIFDGVVNRAVTTMDPSPR